LPVSRPRHLLESSDLSVDQAAGNVGFATGASLRQHLHAAILEAQHQDAPRAVR
jgi:transcriptional regulator GlxA family with amidase domain